MPPAGCERQQIEVPADGHSHGESVDAPQSPGVSNSAEEPAGVGVVEFEPADNIAPPNPRIGLTENELRDLVKLTDPDWPKLEEQAGLELELLQKHDHPDYPTLRAAYDARFGKKDPAGIVEIKMARMKCGIRLVSCCNHRPPQNTDLANAATEYTQYLLQDTVMFADYSKHYDSSFGGLELAIRNAGYKCLVANTKFTMAMLRTLIRQGSDSPLIRATFSRKAQALAYEQPVDVLMLHRALTDATNLLMMRVLHLLDGVVVEDCTRLADRWEIFTALRSCLDHDDEAVPV
jgi:hypothetical protein